MKDFSYLRWPGVPLFVTDVVLVVLLVAICFSPRRAIILPSPTLNTSLTLFIAAGALAATRGFLAHRDSILVLRDSALIEYTLFLLVGYHVCKDWRAIRMATVWFILGTSLSVLNGFAWFLAAPEQRRFVTLGIYILISLIGVLLMMASGFIRERTGWIIAVFFCLGLLLSNARSLFVSLAVVGLVVLFVPGMRGQNLRSASVVSTLLAVIVLASASTLLFRHLRAGRDFTTRVADNLASGVLHTNADPYWQFRLVAWREAWKRFEEYPMAGEGFGVPFTFEIWDNDPRPHNTFLTVLYKMGLLGLLPLLAILSHFFWLGLKAVHRNRKNRHIFFLQGVLLAQICFCVYGGANLLLESPFLASLFWTGIGIGLRMIHKCDFERLLRAHSNRLPEQVTA